MNWKLVGLSRQPVRRRKRGERNYVENLGEAGGGEWLKLQAKIIICLADSGFCSFCI